MGFTETLKKLWPLIVIFVVGLAVLLVNEKTGFLEEKPEVDPTENISIVATDEIEQMDETETNVEDGVSDILTIENCEDLANLLSLKDPFDPSVAEFAEEYKGRIVEFDACIAYLSNHGSYDTRYDILLYGCDYSETTVSGPSFQFEDVGVYDLGISDLYLPDYITAGRNVHIVAEVEEFDPNSGLFKLDPVSITDR
ncbi:MAG: DUF4839 domain-containing protein [Oscillospiraceae bacterium]|nr:DUF4839 domain-containing protein [Oscillospiraceae bacterium]